MVSTPGFELWPHWWVACDVLSPMRHPCSPVRPLLTSSRQEMNSSLHFVPTFICATTPNLSTVTLVKALDNVATKSEQMVTPIIIHPTANSRQLQTSASCRRIFKKKCIQNLKRFSYLLRKWFYLCLLLFSTSSSQSPKTD